MVRTGRTNPMTGRAVLAAAAVGVLGLAGAGAAVAAPIAPGDLSAVPERTAITFTDTHTGITVGTAGHTEARPGLSTVKLYMADHVLLHGDGSDWDRERAEAMVRYSDDRAADELFAKYPESIDAPARDYGLTATVGAGYWGDALTSTADTVRFLEIKQQTDPASPVLEWMRTADPVAADGTVQNWGTALLPGAEGSKWGWADHGAPMVNSATIGSGFAVAASTYGTAQDQTDDVLAAFVTVDGDATVSLQTVVGQSLEESFPGDPMVRWVVEATPDVPVPAAG